jgi:hypothetical protein
LLLLLFFGSRSQLKPIVRLLFPIEAALTPHSPWIKENKKKGEQKSKDQIERVIKMKTKTPDST